jgi:hypothetical protein
MNVLGQLIAHYKDYPAMALLRALEIEQFAAVSSDCARPVLDLDCGDGYVAGLAFNRLQNHINLFDENEWRSILFRHGFKTRLIKARCNYAIARYIFWLDFFGKLHFNFRWPFLDLRHRGNPGLILTKIILRFLDLRHILSKYAYKDDRNYCFMIIAVKE